MDKIRVKLGELGEAIEAGLKEIEELESAIKELERARDTEMGGELEQRETFLKEKEKEEAKVSSTLKTLKDNIKQEERKKKGIEKVINQKY